MRCNEFRGRFEIYAPADVPGGSGELAEHLRACTDCRRHFEMQEELRRHLRLLRDSTPGPPPWLGTKVLANYREYLAGRTSPAAPAPPRKRMAPPMLWVSGTVAATLLLAAMLTLAGKNIHHLAPARAIRPADVAESRLPKTASAGITEGITEKTGWQGERAAVHRGRRQPAVVSVARTVGPQPDGFSSLMYCDPLSCPDAMEIIRVQLPTSGTGLESSPASASGIVMADVIVGSDGIARGIRIVE